MKRALVLFFVLLASSAAAQSRDVQLDLLGAFRSEILVNDAGAWIAVRVDHRGTRARVATLVLVSRPYGGPARTIARRFDLAPRTRRTELVHLPGASAGPIEARLEVEGAIVARTSASARNPSEGLVLVLADVPRLEPALSGLNAEVPEPYGYGTASTVVREVPVGSVRRSETSGEWLLPRGPAAYSDVAMLVADPGTLERLDADQLADLERFVVTGGRLWIGLGEPSLVERPIVRRFAGVLGVVSSSGVEDASLYPADLPPITLAGPGATTLTHGAIVRLGRGTVLVTPFDPNALEVAFRPELPRFVRALVELVTRDPSREPILGFGRGRENLDADSRWSYPRVEDVPFSRLRAALDVGSDRRAPLALLTLALLVYVVAIGPFTMRLARLRRAPLLPLVVVPGLALGFLVLVVGAGVATRGLSRRARALVVLDAPSGRSVAMERSYLGLHFGTPTRYSIAGRPGELLRLVEERDRQDAGHLDLSSGRPRLLDVPVRFWDTLYLRRDRMRSIGGPIRLEVDEAGAITRVVNESSLVIEHGFVLDRNGTLSDVARLAPGASRAPTSAGWYARSGFATYEDSSSRALLDRLGLGARGRELVGGGFVTLFTATLRGSDPIFVGRVAVEPGTLPRGFVDRGTIGLVVVTLLSSPGWPRVPSELPPEVEEPGTPGAGPLDAGTIDTGKLDAGVPATDGGSP